MQRAKRFTIKEGLVSGNHGIEIRGKFTGNLNFDPAALVTKDQQFWVTVDGDAKVVLSEAKPGQFFEFIAEGLIVSCEVVEIDHSQSRLKVRDIMTKPVEDKKD